MKKGRWNLKIVIVTTQEDGKHQKSSECAGKSNLVKTGAKSHSAGWSLGLRESQKSVRDLTVHGLT